ncbi:MAG: sodium:solute symporter family transporter, partial [Anaerohalosphaeraceae bacterium]
LLIPVAVQWWAVWYPVAEPGGGGYIAQRMLSAKDEKNAIGATMLFNFMHYAIRPWPWIIVALASLICYPTLASNKTQFPGIDPAYLRQDIAYPVMIAKLGPGFLGLVVASLIAAYMSTIGTHLNWGSSYAVNDFYKRFWNKDATEKQMVRAGRFCTVGLMMMAGIFALTFLEDAYQAFKILLLSGAGTGAIYIMRWFWWRINAWTEIMAMVAATVVAFWIVLGVGSEGTLKWYIGSGAVEDRVFTVADAEIVKEINAQRGMAADQIKIFEAELSALAAAWKKANKESEEARDAARIVYDAKVAEIDAHKAANSVTALVGAASDKSWAPRLMDFYAEQNQWQLDRVNKRREKTGLAPRDPSEVAVEFAGIVSGDTVYIYHPDIANLEFSVQLLVCVGVVTIVWMVTTLITPAVDTKTLRSFYKLCHPGGPGWRKVVMDAQADGEDIDQKNAIGDWKLPIQILCVFLGCVAIYASLFAIGNFVYGNMMWGFILIGIALVTVFFLFKSFNKIGVESSS